MTLLELKTGDKGLVINVLAQGSIKRRLLDMGIVPGAAFKVIRKAPLGDPIQIQLKGFQLSLRKNEAKDIIVDKTGEIGDGVPMRSHKDFITKQENITAASNGMSKDKLIKVGLLGNPNSGKTSLFNALVGANQKVGNFSGVTVEKVTGEKIWNDRIIRFIDLPGTYSLTAYSEEEKIARNYILDEQPDIILNVLDGTNLERNLYLTTQLMEMDVNFLIALNMYDEVKTQKTKIDFDQMEKLLGSHIIPVSATQKDGLRDLLNHIVSVYEGDISIQRNKFQYSPLLEDFIGQFAESLQSNGLELQNWERIKLIEEDPVLIDKYRLSDDIQQSLNQQKDDFFKKTGKNIDVSLTEDRHAFIRGAVRETVKYRKHEKKSLTDKIDAILLHRVLGLPLFLLIMWGTFQLTFTLGEYPMAAMEWLFGKIALFAANALPDGILQDILIDGIINGVGGVLVFLPNILILFLCISFLEGSGYMSRASFVVDKFMHLIGLHGKSFIPMLTGFGCSVPAFMACRTLKNPADRLTTMLVIPFMSCSAKMPVYILLVRTFFPAKYAGTILFAIYFTGIITAIITAKLLKLTIFRGESEPFVMELPPYRNPGFRSLLFQLWNKTKMYLKKAATVILVASVIIWLISHFPVNRNAERSAAERMQEISLSESMTEREKKTEIEEVQLELQTALLEYSIAGRLGKAVTPIFRPLGFDWKINLSLIAGLTAKEVVVSTLATIYAISEDEEGFSNRLRNDPNLSLSTVSALLVFVLLYTPCLAATVVFHKEAGKWKWTALYFLLTIVVAWIVAFIIKIGVLGLEQIFT